MIDTDILLENDDYVAYVSSKRGGTCFRLRHKKSNREILRFPNDAEELEKQIFLYGNPILFPCNRIRGGEFTFEGKTYTFPINEPSTNCHIHGELYRRPFEILERTATIARLRYQAKEGGYLNFPHSFAVERKYELTNEGLHEWTSIENLSKSKMPVMLAFHTTFQAQNTCFFANVTKEQCRDENFLPTGEYAEDREREREIRKGIYRIGKSHLSALYKVDGNLIRLIGENFQIEYLASKEYGYRMLYAEKDAGFMVAEPQTCAIDCFHLSTKAEENGLFSLSPKQSVTLFTQISLIETK